MTKGPSTRLLRSAGLALMLLTSARVWASEEDDARLKFEAAQSAYDLGDFEKAKRLYSEAYEIKPLPGFLFNIGQCHRKLGEWNKAAFFYRRYFAKMPEGTDTARLEQLIAEMDEKEKGGAPPAPAAVAEKPKESDAPKLVPAVAPKVVDEAVRVTPKPATVAMAHLSPAPIIVYEREPDDLHKRWWLWAGAGVATAATITAIVAVGVAASRPAGDGHAPPKYGKLDAR